MRFAGQSVRVVCDDERAADAARFVFGPHLERAADDAPPVELNVVRDATSGAFALLCNGRLESLIGADGDLELALVQWVQFRLVSPARGIGMFHAASVVRSGRAVLLAAEAGSGKTTLTATLLGHGYGFLSDELTAVGQGGLAEGFARPLNIKTGSLERLRRCEGLAPAFAHARTSAGITLLPWTQASPMAPLSTIVLPAYRAGSDFEVERLSPGRAAAALLSCLLNARNLPKGGIELAGALARAYPVHRVRYARTQDAVDWLEGGL